MKKLIESMDHIEECGMAEGPMGMTPPAMAPEMDKGNPVTVNVSMNASGKEHVADLLDMMKNAGLGDAAPAADAMMSPRMDMERLSGIMGKPEHDHDDDKMNLPAVADLDGGEDESYASEMELEGGLEDDPCPACEGEGCDECDNTGMAGVTGDIDKYDEDDEDGDDDDDEHKDDEFTAMDQEDDDEVNKHFEDMADEGTYTIKVKGKDMDSQMELARIASLSGVAAPQEMETEASGDYANEPDEQYSDLSAVIPDGDDLHKKKKTHPATAGGDNPMAVENIKAALYAALTEKKMSEGEVPAGLKAYQAKKGKGKAPAKGKSKSGKMPMDAGKDGKKGTKDDKPAFLTKEGYGGMVSKQTKDRVEKDVAANSAALAKKGKNPDGSPKKKDTKTAEGRGKVMAGRGRGKKPKLMAGRGRGK